MSDHVVGHFSSSVRTPDAWYLRNPVSILDMDDVVRGGLVTTKPLRLFRLSPPPDPADWRFREDGY